MSKLIKSKAIFEIFLVITITIYSGVALAQPSGENPFTCLEDNNGINCVETTDTSICPPENVRFVSKEMVPECNPGCCVLNGEVMDGVAKSSCEGGDFRPGSCSRYQDLAPVCCVLGDQWKITTEEGCYNLRSELEYDIEPLIEPATNPFDCSVHVKKDNAGCCVREFGGACTWEQGETCDGEFYPNTACNSELINGCEKNKGEVTASCGQAGTNTIIWQDSQGEFTGAEQECDYLGGKVCKDGECVDASCDSSDVIVPAYLKDRISGQVKNTESWCWYNSREGPAADLPGAVHYIHRCLNGERVVEELPQDRSEICINIDPQGNDGLRQATKIENKFSSGGEVCMDCKSKNCCENPTQWSCVWVGDSETKGICLPLSPPGMKVTDQHSLDFLPEVQCGVGVFSESHPTENSNYGFVSHKALWISELGNGYDWECQGNCNLYLGSFAEGMNSVCMSYGDCGASFGLSREWSNDAFTRTCGEDYNDLFEDAEEDDDKHGPSDWSSKTLLRLCKSKLPTPSDIESFFTPADVLTIKELAAPDSTKGAVSLRKMIQEYGDRGYTQGETVSLAIFVPVAVTMALVGGLIYAGIIAAASVPVWGWIAGAVLIIAAGVLYAIDSIAGGEEKESIKMTCGPWQPPRSSDFCYLCNEPGEINGQTVDLTAEGSHPCTQYLCLSLGSGCKFVKTDEENTCIEKEETTPPGIGPLEGIEEINSCVGGICKFESKSERGFKLGPKLQAYKEIKLGVTTYKTPANREKNPTKCRISKTSFNSYDDIENFDKVYEDMGEFKINHEFSISPSQYLEPNKDINYYVRCVTYDGKENPAQYEIKFQVEEQVPGYPPTYKVTHATDFMIPYEVNATIVKLIPNLQPMEICRYDTEDKLYDNMEKMTRCEDICTLGFEEINEVGNHNYYVRCKDHYNNTNPQSEQITITKTDPLKIDSVTCTDPLTSDCGATERYFSHMELTATTSGGAESGKAFCGGTHSDSTEPLLFEFSNTDHNVHSGLKLQGLPKGKHTINVVCKDKAGNMANKLLNFNILKDESDPILEKVYTQSDQLIVETDEESDCSYSSTPKDLFESPQSFSSSDNKLHTAPKGVQNKFIIICKDKFENEFDVTNIYLNKA